MPDLVELFAVLFLIGVVSSGVTQIIKLAGRLMVPKSDNDPVWWQVAFRIIPTAIGAGMGTQFFVYPWGVGVGACGGLLSVVLFTKARAIIENMSQPKV